MSPVVAVRERPILFSAQMIRSLIARIKTQTRRLSGLDYINSAPNEWCSPDKHDDFWRFVNRETGEVVDIACPYGKSGDLLWVREAWRTGDSFDKLNGTEIAEKATDAGFKPGCPIKYGADDYVSHWGDNDAEDFGDWGRRRHARFMPRWASRITLEITAVRAERLNEISEDDALAEGVEPWGLTETDIAHIQISDESPETKAFAQALGPGRLSAKAEYQMLWDEINGKDAWGKNPFVWVITFKRIPQGGAQ